MITILVFWQVSNFFGNRFNFISSVTYMRQGMPDIFILILIGTLPDTHPGDHKNFPMDREEDLRYEGITSSFFGFSEEFS